MRRLLCGVALASLEELEELLGVLVVHLDEVLVALLAPKDRVHVPEGEVEPGVDPEMFGRRTPKHAVDTVGQLSLFC